MSTKVKLIILISIIVLLIALVVVMSFIGSPKDLSGDIDYKDYNKVIKEEKALVYYGTSSNKTKLDEFSKTYGASISALNPNSLSKSERNTLGLKDGYLYGYKNGKEVYNADFNNLNYESVKELMEKELIKGNYIEVSIDEYEKLIKEKGFNIMFIGRETCSWCTQFKDSIKTAMETENFIIYYIDTDKLGEEGFKRLYATDEYLTKEEWGTPLTFIYKDGKRVGVIDGYKESADLIDVLKENKVLE